MGAENIGIELYYKKIKIVEKGPFFSGLGIIYFSHKY
jgi:hypothetical protein